MTLYYYYFLNLTAHTFENCIKICSLAALPSLCTICSHPDPFFPLPEGGEGQPRINRSLCQFTLGRPPTFRFKSAVSFL